MGREEYGLTCSLSNWAKANDQFEAGREAARRGEERIGDLSLVKESQDSKSHCVKRTVL
jgi:hypothetical protein